MINKFTVLVFFSLLLHNVSAQEIIASGGEVYTNTQGSISFTVGETNIATFSNSSANIILTQGYQQTYNVPTFRIIDFSGNWKCDSLLLNLKVQNDYDIYSYKVEKSFDSIHFNAIGNLLSFRNNLSTNNYSITDKAVNNSKNYYRIMVKERNGLISYSQIILLDIPNFDILKIYPNPFKNNLFIEYSSKCDNLFSINLFDESGRLVFKKPLNILSGNNLIPLKLASLPSGVYLLSGIGKEIIKIIKE